MGRAHKSVDWYKNYVCGLGGKASWKCPNIGLERSENINTDVNILSGSFVEFY
jgi:hypothetical protein